MHLNKAVNDIGVQQISGSLWKKSLSVVVLRSEWRNYTSINLKKNSEMCFFLIPLHTVGFVNFILKYIIFHRA